MPCIRRSRDPLLVEPYLVDSCRRMRGSADEIAWPQTHDETRELLSEWSESRVRVTPSGAGTGVACARVPEGGAVLATERMRRVGSPREGADGRSALLTVGAGVPLETIDEIAAADGWLYPPNPTEATAFIGGTVSTNAAGARSFRFGSTRRWISGLRGVLADGRSFNVSRGQPTRRTGRLVLPLEKDGELEIPAPRWRVPETRKCSAGYYSAPGMDVVDLLVGAEGTLAVITEVELVLVRRPASIMGGMFFFDDERAAFRFVSGLQSERERDDGTWCVELFDACCVEIARRTAATALPAAGAAIYVEIGVAGERAESDAMRLWSEHADGAGGLVDAWIGASADDRARFRAMRHALPVSINELLARRGVPKASTDTAVPPGRIEEYVTKVRRRAERDAIEHVVFGHVGDANVHVNLLAADERQLPTVERALTDIVRLAVELGGTVSAEHGIGKVKRTELLGQLGPGPIESMRAIKRVFDPDARLARGNIFAVDARA